MNAKVFCSMLIQLFALLFMFCLAFKYDGQFIWVFFLIAGAIVGIDLPHLLQLLSAAKKK